MKKEINSTYFKKHFEKSADVLVRPINIRNQTGLYIHLFCVDGLLNTIVLDEEILRPLAVDEDLKKMETEKEILTYLLEGGTYHAFVSETDDIELVLKGVMSGMAALVFDREKKVLLFDVRAFDKRSLQEPSEEGVLKGAKDCFIEVLRTNTAMLRRRIRSEYLVVEQLSVGKLSKTDLAIVYQSDFVDMKMVDKLRNALQDIDIDNVAAPGFIEEFIIDNRRSIFPQVMYTQRPDRFAANISDGRIGLIIDGIPFVYILPCQLPMLMQSPEDYAVNYLVSSSLRVLRYFSFILTLFLPAFYIAVTTFQNQMLPIDIALSIQSAKANVPFPSFIEVLALLAAFEILIESGLRLPKTIGQAMSIVGGLVVGQAAVEANILSPSVVIVVALTGIAGFTMSNQDLSNAVRIVRFGFAILASAAGFFGVIVGVIWLLIHLCSLDNYGVAYLSPFVDSNYGNDTRFKFKDVLVRFPVRNYKYRPDHLADKNPRKQK